MTTVTNDRQQIVTSTMTVIGLVIATSLVLGLLFVARNILMLVFGAILISVVVNHLARIVGNLLPWDLKRTQRVGFVFVVVVVALISGGFGLATWINEQVVKLTDGLINTLPSLTRDS
jgi:predicted PurR-regulated permease PerM